MLSSAQKRVNNTNVSTNLFSFKRFNFVVVGSRRIKNKLEEIETQFNIEIKFCQVSELTENVDSKTLAIIVSEEAIRPQVKKYLTGILDNFGQVPTFFLSSSARKASFFQLLYEKGLAGAISWPMEGVVLHNLLIGTMKPQKNVVGKTKADLKLASMVKSQLILVNLGKGLRIKAFEGVVFIEGVVSTINIAESIKREIINVLGVRQVVAGKLKIRVSRKTSDKELERRIKIYISNVLEFDKKSLGVKVKNGVVTLIGAINSLQDLLTVESFIKRQKGVQVVDRRVKFHPQLVSRKATKAKKLEKKLKDLFSGVKYLRINIFGEFVEVSGTVKFPKTKSLIEDFLFQELAVKKVINKIFVSPLRH